MLALPTCFQHVKSLRYVHRRVQYPNECYGGRAFIVAITPEVIVFGRKGSTCPTDSNNFLELLKELREALGQDKIIAVTVPSDADLVADTVTLIEPLVDSFLIKAFGYSVSAKPSSGGSTITAPFQPLLSPAVDGVPTTSVTQTLAAYDKLGVSVLKTVVVAPTYGTTYYIGSVAEGGWQKYGVAAKVSGECFGPYEQSHGAYTNDATHQCGIVTYHEIRNLIKSGAALTSVLSSADKAEMTYVVDREAFVSVSSFAQWVARVILQ